MNKIYKIIWSKARNCYIVVSEIAKRSGKCSSSLNKKIIASFLAAGTVLSVTGSAWADPLDDKYIQINSTGVAASAAGADAIAIGAGALAENTKIGNSSQGYYGDRSNAMAIGINSHADGETTIAIGYGAYAQGLNAMTIGYSVMQKDDEGNELGKGAMGTNAMAIGPQALAKGYNATAIGGQYNRAIGTGATTVGAQAWALADYTTASGYLSRAIGNGSVATGAKSQATGNYSVATGEESQATGDNSIATGYYSQATGDNSIATGYYSQATGDNSIATGYYSQATGDNSIASGYYSTATGAQSTANGYYSQASGDNSIASGYYSQAKGAQSVAVGAFTNYSGNDSEGTTAIGYLSSVNVPDGVALGSNSFASTAAGTTTEKSGYDPTTGGRSTKEDATWRSTKGAVSVGSGGTDTRQITNVAAGYEETDAVNVAQLKQVAGGLTHYFSVKSTETGEGSNYNNDGATGSNSMAAGVRARATDISSVAIGAGAVSEGNSAIAIGSSAQVVKGSVDSVAIGHNAKAYRTQSIAIGRDSQAGEDGAAQDGSQIAIGYGSKATGKSAISIGIGTNASGVNSLVFGNGATAIAASAVAIGNQASASLSGDVSVGNKSVSSGGTSSAYGQQSQATGQSSSSFGAMSKASAKTATAVGYHATATGIASVALGAWANDEGNDSKGITAVGYDSAVTAEYGVTLGMSSKTTVLKGVALGAQSVADRAAGVFASDASGKAVNGKNAYDPIAVGQVHDEADTSSTWVSKAGAVSVGNSTTTRQITNVAAGSAETDAVNVAQLKQVVTAVDGAKTHYYHVNSTITGAGSNYDNDGATGTNALAAGVNAKAIGEDSVAIGNGATAEGKGAIVLGSGGARAHGKNAMAWGEGAQAGASPEEREEIWDKWSATRAVSLTDGEHRGYGDNATAWGLNTKAYGQYSTAFGEGTKAYAPSSTAFGTFNEAWGRDSTAWGHYTKALGEYSTAFGRGNLSDQDGDGELDYVYARGESSTAFGESTQANGQASIAFGSLTKAETYLDTAFGFGTTASGSMSTAFGNYTEASGRGSTAFGIAGVEEIYDEEGYPVGSVITNPVIARGTGSTAFGFGTEAQGAYSTSFGYDTTAQGLAATAFGVQTETNGQAATAFGQKAKALNLRATAFGGNTTAAGKTSTAFGEGSKAYGDNSLAALGGTTGAGSISTNQETGQLVGKITENAQGAVAIGDGALAQKSYTYAIGQDAQATADKTVAIGNGAEASYAGSVALGQGSKALEKVDEPSAGGYNPITGEKDYTDNTKTWTATTGPVSVGSSDVTRQIKYVAAGNEDTDAVNVAQLKQVASGLTHDYSVNSVRPATDSNYNNKGATGNNALAAGVNAKAQGYYSTVVGDKSEVLSTERNYTVGMKNPFTGETITRTVDQSGVQGVGAVNVGAMNIVGAADDNAYGFDGVANSIVGVANKTEKANGAIIMGAGNVITNSYDDEALKAALKENATALLSEDAATYRKLVKDAGGDVLAIGGANEADYAVKSSMIGVKNKIIGTSNSIAELNSSIGYSNTIENGSNNSIIGTNRKVSGVNGVVVIGSADPIEEEAPEGEKPTSKPLTTSVANAVVIGTNANVEVADGVALGSGSVTANALSDVSGYDAGTGKASEDTSATWKPTLGEVSVGGNGDTRRITNVAAGSADTDAVNVAQLKQVVTAVDNSKTHYYHVNSNETGKGSNYDNDGATGKNAIAAGLRATATEDNAVAFGNGAEASVAGGIALGSGSVASTPAGVTGVNPLGVDFDASSPAWTSTAGALSVGNVTITRDADGNITNIKGTTRQITGVAAGTNPTDAVNVAQLQGTATHYYSVNENKAHDDVAGDSNYDNSGATGKGSLAAGYYANASGEESTAFGYGSQSQNDSSSSLGSLSKATAKFATAVGHSAQAIGVNSTATGSESVAAGENSTAVGLKSEAFGKGTIAIGHESTAGALVSVTKKGEGTDVYYETDVIRGGENKEYIFRTLNDTATTTNGEENTSGGNTENTENTSGGNTEPTVNPASVKPAGKKLLAASPMKKGLLGDAIVPLADTNDATKDGSGTDGGNSGTVVAYNVLTQKYHEAKPDGKGGYTIGNVIEVDETSLNMGGIAMGSYAHAEGYRSMSIGRASGSYGEDSTAIGIYANAMGKGDMALGHGSSTGVKVRVVEGGADDFWTTSFYEADEKGKETTTPLTQKNADGKDVSVLDKNSNPVSNGNNGGIAIGSYSHTEGTRALAVGRVASAYGTNSTAIGLRSSAYGEGSMAFGHGVVAGNKDDAYAEQVKELHENPQSPYDLDGERTKLVDAKGNAILDKDGNEQFIKVDPNNVIGAVAMGSYAEATGRGSLSVGRYSKAQSAYSTALGIRAVVGEKANNAIAIGREATVEEGAENSVAIGEKSAAYGINSTAFGLNSTAYGEGSMAFGHGVVAGDKDNPKNKQVDELHNNPYINYDLDGKATTFTDDEGVEHTVKVDPKNVIGAVALGSYAEATGRGSLSVGRYSKAQSAYSTAMGIRATVGKDGKNGLAIGRETNVNGENSVAIGKGSTVTGKDSIAIGTGHTVTGSNSGTFGDPNIINAAKSYVVGNNSNIEDDKITDAFILGNNASVTKTGGVALGSYSIADTDKGITGYDPATATTSIKTTDPIWTATASALSVGGGTVEGTVVTRQITNVAAGSKATDAVNVAQLKASRVEIKAGDNITVTTSYGDDGHAIYTLSGSPETVVQAGTSGNVTVDGPAETPSSTPAEGSSSDAGTGAGTETAATGGTTGTGTAATGGTAGTGTAATGGTTGTGTAATGGTTGTEPAEKTDKGTYITNIYTVDAKDTRNTIVAGDDSVNITSDTNQDGSLTYTITAKAKGSSNVKVIDGKNTTVTPGKDGDFTTYAVNVITNGKVASGDTGIVTGDTVYNETRVQNDGNYVKKDSTAGENITALDNQVNNNSQNIENLGNAINNTNSQINSLDNRMRKGLAGAAALAALHPMDFNPDDKLQFAAGVGNYRGETAAALGAFYRPDESVMFSIGGTFGNADNMVNAGITFGLDGTRNRITRSRTAMAREIQDLRSLVTQMAARMDRLENANGIETTMFPDVPENHWAYEYVEDLQKRGALKGYPDGLFKGDRAMTRYEFAAMLDRIVRSGVTLDPQIAKEFEPELGRIYVERISGQDNDRKKIERVRVNNSDSKYPEGKTRDVYGSKIQPVVSEKAAGE